MKPTKLGFLLGVFIFCSLAVPVLSSVARLTRKICDRYKDPCIMDVEPGSCYEVHFRYFYNQSSKACESFLFTGCNGNLNNYHLKIECQIACVELFRTVRWTKAKTRKPTTAPAVSAPRQIQRANLQQLLVMKARGSRPSTAEAPDGIKGPGFQSQQPQRKLEPETEGM